MCVVGLKSNFRQCGEAVWTLTIEAQTGEKVRHLEDQWDKAPALSRRAELAPGLWTFIVEPRANQSRDREGAIRAKFGLCTKFYSA